jgi:hypothetical protein
MPRTGQTRESETEEDDDRSVDERSRRPDRDDGDEYAEPERVSRRDPNPSREIEEEELGEDDIIEELSDDDLDRMEGPDA